MATTLEEVAAYLKRDGRRFLWEVDGEQLLCHAAGANNRYEVEIRLSEEGECLHLRVPRVAALGQSPHAGILCARILELHFQIKLGRFGLDPLDGEIDCEIVIPLDDATLTYRQLRRALGTLVLLVDQQKPRFEAILATGEDPSHDDVEAFDDFLDQLAATLGMSRAELAAHLSTRQEGEAP